MQAKYLDSIIELYGEDFHIVSLFAHCQHRHRSELKPIAIFFPLFCYVQVKVPLETSEIRGTDKLKEFSKYLVQPFQPPQ